MKATRAEAVWTILSETEGSGHVIDALNLAFVGAATLAGFCACFVEWASRGYLWWYWHSLSLGVAGCLGWVVAGLLVLFFATRVLVAFLAGRSGQPPYILIVVSCSYSSVCAGSEERCSVPLELFPLPDLAALYAKEVAEIGALNRCDAAFDFVASGESVEDNDL